MSISDLKNDDYDKGWMDGKDSADNEFENTSTLRGGRSMNDPDWKVELTKLVGEVDYRAEINRVRVSRVYEEVEILKSKVRILEGKALDKEQDLALNKLGQMRETRQEAIKRALNEGYNDGFKDGFREGERYRSDV
jgi:flagellar biosynthesis/type III secretory pathway protein FliH